MDATTETAHREPDFTQTTDAARWAAGFMKHWTTIRELDPSEVEGTMIGWFANAIEMTRILDGRPDPDVRARAIELAISHWRDRGALPDHVIETAKTFYEFLVPHGA